jgi:sugar/nucleoside kinase (ribokinase family)
MLLAALLRGHDWPLALSLANGMAAAMCGERGPVPAELDRFYAPWRAALEQAA